MRDWFVFHYHGRYFRCVALPFGSGRSPLWFTQLMDPFVRALRGYVYPLLAYLDDFLIVPSPHVVVASTLHLKEGTEKVEGLLSNLGLTRNPHKGEWDGNSLVEHLGVVINTYQMRFQVVPRKAEKVRTLEKGLLRSFRSARRWVSDEVVRHFCGLCVSLTLVKPWARFYTRPLYWDLGRKVLPGR